MGHRAFYRCASPHCIPLVPRWRRDVSLYEPGGWCHSGAKMAGNVKKSTLLTSCSACWRPCALFNGIKPILVLHDTRLIRSRSQNFLGSLGRTPCHDVLFVSYPAHRDPFSSSKDFLYSFTTINPLAGAGEFATLTRRGLRDNPADCVHS